MPGRLGKIAAVLIIGLLLFLPLIEWVDFWDNFRVTGDMELSIFEFLTRLALLFVLAAIALLRNGFHSLHAVRLLLSCRPAWNDLCPSLNLAPPEAPPPPLPLRI